MKERRILLVDDNPLNVELVSFMLEAAGFALATATDGKMAQERIASFRPDVILMDIQLPGIDGLTLTRLIKEDPSTAHMVVIAFTAFAMKGDEARMRAAGCDGYISKPINVATFVRQIDEAMVGTR